MPPRQSACVDMWEAYTTSIQQWASNCSIVYDKFHILQAPHLAPDRRHWVDEIQYAKGHKYLTLVYQIDLGLTRLLWVGKERTIESFQGFFTAMGQEVISKICFVCSDMWEPYLKLIREKCSEALHILDRFHIVAKMNKALDEVRSDETGRMKQEGRDPILRKSRWLPLKGARNQNFGSR